MYRKEDVVYVGLRVGGIIMRIKLILNLFYFWIFN